MQALQRRDEEYASESSEMIMEQQSQTAPWRKSMVVLIGSALLVASMVIFNTSSHGLDGVTKSHLINFEQNPCSEAHTNCMESRCCTNTGFKCYMKNQYWSNCNATCNKDHQDDYDKSQNITLGWNCKELKPGDEAHCAKDTEDCSTNTNCCDGGGGEKMICFRKAPGWSNCNPTCTRTGENSYDKGGGAWSCEHHELICEPALGENATPAEKLACCEQNYCDGKNCTENICTFYEELVANDTGGEELVANDTGGEEHKTGGQHRRRTHVFN